MKICVNRESIHGSNKPASLGNCQKGHQTADFAGIDHAFGATQGFLSVFYPL